MASNERYDAPEVRDVLPSRTVTLPTGWRRTRSPGGPAVLRVGLYVLIVLAALVIVTCLRSGPSRTYVYGLGLKFALVGFAILLMQAVLAARLRWAEWPFGLDMLLRFHKAMALLALVLLLWHPVLLAWGSGRWWLLYRLNLPWNVLLGKAALLVLAVNWSWSQFRRPLRAEFQKWRGSHNVLGLFIFAAASVHSYITGGDLAMPVLRVVWPAAVLTIVLVYLYHKVLRPRRLRRTQYRVVEVVAEAPRVTTIRLQPPAAARPALPWPGQFHYLTLHRHHPGLPCEEHHWTISSAPDPAGVVASTIKAVGDFTRTVPFTQVGDTAEVLGPYGRFSYVLSARDGDLAFIAGGVGITPLMAMIRHLHNTGSSRKVLLLYANRTEEDIVFRQELDQLAASGHPQLTVVHVLSQPAAGWPGARGHIDAALLRQHCRPREQDFYLCVPEGLYRTLIPLLRQLGVPSRRVHYERFSL